MCPVNSVTARPRSFCILKKNRNTPSLFSVSTLDQTMPIDYTIDSRPASTGGSPEPGPLGTTRMPESDAASFNPFCERNRHANGQNKENLSNHHTRLHK